MGAVVRIVLQKACAIKNKQDGKGLTHKCVRPFCRLRGCDGKCFGADVDFANRVRYNNSANAMCFQRIKYGENLLPKE